MTYPIGIHADHAMPVAGCPDCQAEPTIEATLACGDTISVRTVPAVGTYRHCIHCDSRKRVTAVVNHADQAATPTADDFLAALAPKPHDTCMHGVPYPCGICHLPCPACGAAEGEPHGCTLAERSLPDDRWPRHIEPGERGYLGEW